MKKILIVDDEKLISSIISFNLKKVGYETIVANNGEEGLESVRLYNPDLILLDIMMPKMDGNTFCKELKKRLPNFDKPIIIMTAKHDADQIMQSYSLGAVDYVAKPFKIEALLEIIERNLSGSTDKKENEDYISL